MMAHVIFSPSPNISLLARSIFRKVITIVIKVGLILIYPKQADTTQQPKMLWSRKALMEFCTIFIKPASY